MSGAADPFAALGARPVDPFAALGARPVTPSPANMTPQDLEAAANAEFAKQGLPAAAGPSRAVPRVEGHYLSSGLPAYRDALGVSTQDIGNATLGALQSGYDTLRHILPGGIDAKVTPAVRALGPMPGAAGKAGALAEQIGEMEALGPGEKGAELLARFGPEGSRLLPALGRIFGSTAAGATSAKLHGGDVKSGALIGGGLQGVGELTPTISAPLLRAAKRQYGKFFGQNGARLNAEAAEVIPELLNRRVRTRSAQDLADLAGENFSGAGRNIDQLIDAAVEEANRPNLNLKALPPPIEKVGIPASPEPPAVRAIPADRVTVLRPADLTKLDVDPNAAPQRLLPLGPVEPPQQLPLTEGFEAFTPDIQARPEGFDRPRAHEGFLLRPQSPSAEPPMDRPLVDLRPVREALQSMRGNYLTRGVPASTTAVNAIKNLEDEIALTHALGEHIPLRDARTLRQQLDEPLGRRGFFYQAPEEQSRGAQQLTKANALRHQIGETLPAIKPINKEANFWAKVGEVAGKRAEKEAVSQGGIRGAATHPLLIGLGALGGLGAGHGVEGALTGALGGTALSALDAGLRSPLWQTTAAVAKSDLARAAERGALRRAASKAVRVAVPGSNAVHHRP